MKLPFTKEQFLEIFASYNLSVWPMQIILILLALVMILIAVKRNSYSDQLISWGLAFYWLWIGIVYHIIFFAKINPAANIFGGLFIAQGILFLYLSSSSRVPEFNLGLDAKSISAIIFFIYALIIYPLLGYQFGRGYPRNPTFGLPCPTTIFTFGILLTIDKPRIILFIIPVLWALIGFIAALKLGIYEDIGLLASAILTLTSFLWNRKNFSMENKC